MEDEKPIDKVAIARPTTATGPRPTTASARSASAKSKSGKGKRTSGKKSSSSAAAETGELSPAEQLLMNITSPRDGVSEVKPANVQLGSEEIEKQDTSTKAKPQSAKGRKNEKKRAKLGFMHRNSSNNLLKQNIPITQGA